MPVPAPAVSNIFADHFEDTGQPLLPARVASRMRVEGLVTFDALNDRAAVLELAATLMRITPHRDSGPDGITQIRSLPKERGDELRGRRGLGAGDVLPHTDSAQASAPPRLVLLGCERPADTGGASILIDGKAVHDELACEHPEALEALEGERAAFFGTGSGRFTPVFRRRGDGRVILALRQDELASFAPAVQPHLPTLQRVIERHALHLTLQAGQGYLLDNHRWLHGRTAFQGPRALLRALGDPLPRLALPDGFSAAHRRPT